MPYEGIETLLKEFADRLPLPASFAELRAKGEPAIGLLWVLKVKYYPFIRGQDIGWSDNRISVYDNPKGSRAGCRQGVGFA